MTREYSARTVEKYIRDLKRFFRDTGAPDRTNRSWWRGNLVAKGNSAASVNAMPAAVNGYQEFCGNSQGKARSLKCQRRVFCELHSRKTHEIGRARFRSVQLILCVNFC